MSIRHAPAENYGSSVASILALIALTIACLAPFAGKAFNIDDPLFIWVARQINAHPFDFYGFTINWYGHEMPASQIIKNPPFASYYTALAAQLFGWGETTLHLAFLAPALAALTGCYFLAREFSAQPLAAALACLAAPVFLVSSSTVMCDTMMLSLYVWAVFLWVRGVKNDRIIHLVGAAFLVSLCGLTKYFGISLIPLLLVYSMTARQGKTHRALLLIIPVAVLAIYQLTTSTLYGRGLLLDAVAYATEARDVSGLIASLFIGLSFTGGCLLSTFFFAPLLWHRRILLPAALLIALGTLCLTVAHAVPLPPRVTWDFTVQFFLFIAAGINVLSLAGHDLWQRKDADSLLLFLWIAGTFVFATFVNWSTNGRSILPMAPAAAILVMRRLQERSGGAIRGDFRRTILPLAPALLIALLVTWADYRLADTARSAAGEACRNYGSSPSTLWFQGHWGFQYYMETCGGKAFDTDRTSISAGDIMVIPENNTNIFPQFMKAGYPLQIMQFTASSFLATVGKETGAGFYSDIWGPLPFAFGRVPAETYSVIGFSKLL